MSGRGKIGEIARTFLPGSLSDKRQFKDAIALAVVAGVAFVAFEVTRWIGIRVMFWICVVGVVLVGLGLAGALFVRLADPEARKGFADSWRAYRSARRDGGSAAPPDDSWTDDV